MTQKHRCTTNEDEGHNTYKSRLTVIKSKGFDTTVACRERNQTLVVMCSMVIPKGISPLEVAGQNPTDTLAYFFVILLLIVNRDNRRTYWTYFVFSFIISFRLIFVGPGNIEPIVDVRILGCIGKPCCR